VGQVDVNIIRISVDGGPGDGLGLGQIPHGIGAGRSDADGVSQRGESRKAEDGSSE